MNVIYITFGELISGGILRTQVISLLYKMAQRMKNKSNLLLISFIPLRSFITDRVENLKVKEKFGLHNFHIWIMPIPLFCRFFYMPIWLLPILFCWTIPFLFYISLNYKINLIHARSYPAALFSSILTKFVGCSLIFDPRGLYPEESVLYRKSSYNSMSYKLWKKIEKKLLQEAHQTVVVSQTFAEHIKKIEDNANIYVIPCCVNTEVFKQDKRIRYKYRKKYGFKEKFVLLYSGGTGGWYDLGPMVDYFLHFKKIALNAHLLILTPKVSIQLEKILKEKIQDDEYTIIIPRYREIPNLLLMGDVGLFFLPYCDMSHTLLSIKVGEYLACGLPAIVSSTIGEASRLINKYDCGIAVNLNKSRTSFDKELVLLKNYRTMQKNGILLVNDYLSIEKCAEKYLNLYNKLA
ncbi:glycosyltransferase [candidate division WOR-3 bacterium]|nr:glycosyltransferase [candidate division WOR-3 bacterium]